MTGTLNVALLDRLREAGGEFVAWSILIAEFSEAPAHIAALSDFGFVLESHPVQGVAYRGPSPRLCPDQIEHNLGTRIIGRQVAVWNRVTSTNDLAMRAASSRSNHGLAILAEEQTAGRGSRGRVWTAPPRSSILFSVLLFPPPELDDPVWLNALAAWSVASVVWGRLGEWLDWPGYAEESQPPVTIKWPNDVRVNGRKVAGILVERGKGAVIGIGLNANLTQTDLPDDLREVATSLSIELGRPVDRSALVRDILGQLDFFYSRAVTDGPHKLNLFYNWHSEHLGHEVEVETEGGIVAGRLGVLDLRRGLEVGLSRSAAQTVPIGAFAAITNQPGSTFWTKAEQAAWFGDLDPSRYSRFQTPRPAPIS